MTKAFTPKFTSINKIDVIFSTNNPLGEDRFSNPVKIKELTFNETTRSIEATGSDGYKRQCRIDRITHTETLKQLTKDLQKCYDNETLVRFIAAGGNDPKVWFYNIDITE
jgi:beta-lactamase class A